MSDIRIWDHEKKHEAFLPNSSAHPNLRITRRGVCVRASLNWRVRCTHASLPPLAHITYSTRRVSRVFPNDHASPSRIEKPFLHLPNTRVNHHFLPTTSQSVFPVVDQRLPFTSVWILRGSCGGNRRVPSPLESERVLEQRGTFHHGDATVRKSFEIDGNYHSRKRAFG
jgi:hypothetical protein